MAKEIQRETIRQIALRAKAMGGRAMLVGGCVRDALLGRESADIDCEVYGLPPEQLHALAAQFGTVDEAAHDTAFLPSKMRELIWPCRDWSGGSARSTAILT